MSDHIHMLVSILHNNEGIEFYGYLKGKFALMIFDRHANLKYKSISPSLTVIFEKVSNHLTGDF